MSIDELCALPVETLAEKDCLLFLWATFPQLPEALRLIRAWGFTFKTVAFVWLKLNKKSPTWFYGLGYWTRGNAEICLLAKRGKPKRRSAGVHQFIISPVEEHSKKPDVTRDKIIELAGDLPRVELFARQKAPGWDVWGNEVDSDLSLTPQENGNVKKCAVGKHPKSEKHGNTAQFSEVERSGTQENCGGIGSGCLLRLHPLPVPRRRQPKRVACIDPDAVVVDKNIAKNDRFDLFSR